MVGMGTQNPCLVFAPGDTGDLQCPGVSRRTEAEPLPLSTFPLTWAGEQPQLLEPVSGMGEVCPRQGCNWVPFTCSDSSVALRGLDQARSAQRYQ